MDLKVFLKNLPAFEEFSSAHLDIFAAALEADDFADGHVFIREGEQGGALFLILQGLVRVTRLEGAEEQELRELGAGEMFGILSLVGQMPAAATCTAKGAVKAARLTAAAFDRLFETAAPIARHLQYMTAVQLARDLRQQNARMRSAITDR